MSVSVSLGWAPLAGAASPEAAIAAADSAMYRHKFRRGDPAPVSAG